MVRSSIAFVASLSEVSEYLVGSPAFKAGGTGDPRTAGSIPVHLRHSSLAPDEDQEPGSCVLPRARIRRRLGSAELLLDLAADISRGLGSVAASASPRLLLDLAADISRGLGSVAASAPPRFKRCLAPQGCKGAWHLRDSKVPGTSGAQRCQAPRVWLAGGMGHPPAADRPVTMAEYGVPDDLEGVLPWSWAAERLEGYRNYWVTTVSPDGAPHSMPVWGVWLDDRPGFYFSCAPTAHKARNLETNKQVVVGGDSTVEVISLEGRADVVTDDGELMAMIDAWIAKYGDEVEEADEASIAEMREFMTQNAVYAVRPIKAFGVIERPDDFGRRATRWRWT